MGGIILSNTSHDFSCIEHLIHKSLTVTTATWGEFHMQNPLKHHYRMQ